jgi:hypothetical protein
MPKYYNFAIETSFTRFYNKANLFAIYQYAEYYLFASKVLDNFKMNKVDFD